MQDEIKDLLKQIDSLNDELSSYADVHSKIKFIMSQIRLTNNKIKKLESNTVEKNGQEIVLITPENTEITVFLTEEIDKKRMKKDGIYEKYLKRKPSIKMKQKKIDEYN